jgi:hypothetical protein
MELPVERIVKQYDIVEYEYTAPLLAVSLK